MQHPHKSGPTRRVALRSLAGALAAGTLGPALAQAYPARPVRLVIPFAPGGPTDLIGRALAKSLSQGLGQQVLAENKPGASGVIGVQAVAQAEPDGYTLAFHEVTATFAIQPHVMKTLPYNVQSGFTPVGLAARGPIFLLVHAGLPARSVKELVALARTRRNGLSFGSAGGAGQLPTHIGPELLLVKTDIKAAHVPYKGTGPALVDLAAGRVDFMMTTGTGSAKAFLEGGQIRAIAVTGAKRSEAMPEVPTFAESGVPLPELEDGTTWGVFGPAGLPAPLVRAVNQAMAEALQSAELRKSFALLDIQPIGGTPQEMRAMIERDGKVWPPLLRKMNIQPE